MLIDAQLEVKAYISKSFDDHPETTDIHDSLISIYQQYEAYTWQIVPIQHRLWLKIDELHEWKDYVNTKVHNDDAMATADEIPIEAPVVGVSKSGNSEIPRNQCRSCGELFNSSRAMAEHQRTVHQQIKKRHITPGTKHDDTNIPNETHTTTETDAGSTGNSSTGGSVHCSQCNKLFATHKLLNEHMKRLHVSSKKIQCTHCDKQYAYRSAYNVHLRTHTGERPYACVECDRTFSTAAQRNTHLEKVHPDREHRVSVFDCVECGERFDSRLKRRLHAREMHPIELLFQCDICPKRFLREEQLTAHLVGHTSVQHQTFPCQRCDKTFNRKHNLHLHVERVHLQMKPVECTICSKSFFSNSELLIHMQRHMGAKPFMCNVCGEAFSSNNTRLHHKRLVHTGERPYQCDICKEEFLIKPQISVHMIKHSGVKPHACDQCDKRYNTAGELTTHWRRMHSGQPPKYSCDVCNKGLATASRLERHKQSHSGAKPFTCDVCRRPLADAETLKIHMRIHTGEKPFECDVCGKKFIDKRDVNKHKKKSHNTAK